MVQGTWWENPWLLEDLPQTVQGPSGKGQVTTGSCWATTSIPGRSPHLEACCWCFEEHMGLVLGTGERCVTEDGRLQGLASTLMLKLQEGR